MMNMMHSTGTGMGTGFPALWGVHALSVVLFAVGVILLILWAARTLNQGQLKTWGITLAVVGMVACLFTVGVRGAPWTEGMTGGAGMKCGNGMMDMDDDDAAGGMNHSMMDGDDAMSMSMDDMSAMLEGKTGDAFDRAFIEGMIPHHQGAIDMALAARESARHEEIKRMAEDIITAQQREIDTMKQWQKDWGYTQ